MSDMEQEAKPKRTYTKRQPPKVAAVMPRSDEATWSVDDVIANRLSGANPFGRRSDNAVPLKNDGKKWHQRWFNQLSDPARLFKARHDLGWVPVTGADLAEGTSVELLGLTTGPDGSIRRGDGQSTEVLFKQPEDVFRQLQARKAQANTKGLRSEAAARDEVANASVQSLGPDAADYLSKNATLTIRDTQERL